MLTPEESKNITYIYNKFLDSETKGWDQLDEVLILLEWLDDSQLYREVEVTYSKQRNKKMGCQYEQDHKPGYICMVKSILEAVECISKIYEENHYMNETNRYILCNYLALVQAGQIVEIKE